MGRVGMSHGSRSAGVLPVLAGVLSAVALTGAAVYTVSEVPCESGRYVAQKQHVTLVGGCVDSAELRDAGIGREHDRTDRTDRRDSTGAPLSNYRP